MTFTTALGSSIPVVRAPASVRWKATAALLAGLAAAATGACTPAPGGPAEGVHDPGVRGGPPGAGGPLPDLSADETAFFQAGLAQFVEVQAVSGDQGGLGPRFNSNQCSSCHSQPAVGGTSFVPNPS